MDGKGRRRDTVFVNDPGAASNTKRFVCAYDSVNDAKQGLKEYFRLDNQGERIRRLTTKRRMNSTSATCLSSQKRLRL